MVLKKFLGKVFAISTHPDDLEFGAFGTLYKYRKEMDLSIFICSLGGMGDKTSGMIRLQESTSALELLGPTSSVSRKEVGVPRASYEDLVSVIENLIKTTDSKTILIPSFSDTHQDHRMIHEVSISAVRRANVNLLNYPVLSTNSEFHPTLFVDISKELEKKMEALALHKSQKDKYYMSKQYLEAFHSDRVAMLQGVRYSERFEVLRAFL